MLHNHRTRSSSQCQYYHVSEAVQLKPLTASLAARALRKQREQRSAAGLPAVCPKRVARRSSQNRDKFSLHRERERDTHTHTHNVRPRVQWSLPHAQCHSARSSGTFSMTCLPFAVARGGGNKHITSVRLRLSCSALFVSRSAQYCYKHGSGGLTLIRFVSFLFAYVYQHHHMSSTQLSF